MKKYKKYFRMALVVLMMIVLSSFLVVSADTKTDIKTKVDGWITSLVDIATVFIRPIGTISILGLCIFVGASHDEHAVKTAKIALIIIIVVTALAYFAKPISEILV